MALENPDKTSGQILKLFLFFSGVGFGRSVPNGVKVELHVMDSLVENVVFIYSFDKPDGFHNIEDIIDFPFFNS